MRNCIKLLIVTSAVGSFNVAAAIPIFATGSPTDVTYDGLVTPKVACLVETAGLTHFPNVLSGFNPSVSGASPTAYASFTPDNGVDLAFTLDVKCTSLNNKVVSIKDFNRADRSIVVTNNYNLTQEDFILKYASVNGDDFAGVYGLKVSNIMYNTSELDALQLSSSAPKFININSTNMGNGIYQPEETTLDAAIDQTNAYRLRSSTGIADSPYGFTNVVAGGTRDEQYLFSFDSKEAGQAHKMMLANRFIDQVNVNGEQTMSGGFVVQVSYM